MTKKMPSIIYLSIRPLHIEWAKILSIFRQLSHLISHYSLMKGFSILPPETADDEVRLERMYESFFLLDKSVKASSANELNRIFLVLAHCPDDRQA
jgi:hypothetical protein